MMTMQNVQEDSSCHGYHSTITVSKTIPSKDEGGKAIMTSVRRERIGHIDTPLMEPGFLAESY